MTRSQLALAIGCGYDMVRKIEVGDRLPGRALRKTIMGVTGIAEDSWPALDEAA